MNKITSTLIGQTIISVDSTSINCWKIRFKNGNYIELWAENDGPLGLPQLWLDAFNDPCRNNPSVNYAKNNYHSSATFSKKRS